VPKLVLNDLVNLQNEQSAVNTINNNSALVEAAIENTLSRNGASPNAMEANLDMNANRIINLPLPVADTEPVRKGEFDEWTGLADALEEAVAAAEAAQAAAEAAEANAETAESNAAASEANAASSETNAATSESNAAASEANAAASEAAAQAAQAAAEAAQAAAELAETNAETAETNAESAQTAAEAAQIAAEQAALDAAQSAAEAENAADNFDDVYLGSKPSDPTVDNDGDPLVEGQLYWNNVANNLRIYDGATWQAYSAASGMTALVDDTNPTLGGDLNLGGFKITSGPLLIGSDTVLTDADIGTSVEPYDASILRSADIGVSVQAYDADLTTWAGITPGTGVGTALGVNVGSAGAVVVNGGALGTPVSGTLTNCTGLPLSGVVDSTSEALGVGSLELGHASDTPLTRSAAGKLDVAGHTVLTDDEEDQGPITGGASVTVKNLGTVSSGTVTVDVADRSMQSLINGGAFTLDVDTSHHGQTTLLIANGGSAGAITTSGFDVVLGASFTTTNGHVFRCTIEYWGSTYKLLFIERIK
jgi:hypothetical protein